MYQSKTIFAINKVALVVIVLLLFGAIYWFATFDLISPSEYSMATIKLPKKDYKLDIRYFNAGATSSEVIEVFKQFKDGKTELLETYENYDSVLSARPANDSVLILVLGGTYDAGKKRDTFNLSFE